MELRGDDGWLQLTAGLSQDGEVTDDDLLLNITAKVGAYSGADQCWVMGADWKRFLADLRELELRRKGRASVEGASPDDFGLEVFSTDSVGHMALRGHVGWQRSELHASRLEFSFDFEPDLLPTLIRDLSTIRDAGSA